MSFITKDYLITFYFLCVAIGEEYLFRHIIYKILSKEFNILLISIIGSILFAFLLHLNEPFLINLVNRFPSSIILYLIRYKINLNFSIITHWIYNLLLTYLG
ncbi:CPBP family intramembrane glutamic endopeptidase [Staphylococcus warneri]